MKMLTRDVATLVALASLLPWLLAGCGGDPVGGNGNGDAAGGGNGGGNGGGDGNGDGNGDGTGDGNGDGEDPGGPVLVRIEGGGVTVSLDRGATWTATPVGETRKAIAAPPHGEEVWLLASTPDAIVRLEWKGGAWQEGDDAVLDDLGDLDPASCERLVTHAGRTILFGTTRDGEGACRATTDAGRTWTVVEHDSSLWVPTDRRTADIARSAVAHAKAMPGSASINAADVYLHPDGRLAYVHAFANTGPALPDNRARTMRTADGGETWTPIGIEGVDEPAQVGLHGAAGPADAPVAIVTFLTASGVRVSFDGGETWTEGEEPRRLSILGTPAWRVTIPMRVP